MQLNITARHLDLTPALSGYVHRKVEKAQRYFDSVIWAQAILAVEKHRHIVELVVHTPGNTFRTKGEAGDLYSAVDLAAHKLDLHLSRVKDKKRSNHRAHLKDRLGGVPESSEPLLSTAGMEKSIQTPIQVHKVELKLLSAGKAIKELNSNGHPVVLFLNAKTNRISAVYRKGKNGYVILEGEE